MSANLTNRFVQGHNRIVVTHLDDNPVHRILSGVVIKVNGTALPECQESPGYKRRRPL
jgi:hypothetical protein